MVTLSDALAAYCICAKSEAKSLKTVRHITQSVGLLEAFLGGNPDLIAITANDLRRFIIGLQSKVKFSRHPYNKPQQVGLSPYSFAAYCRGVKAFYAYLLRERLIEQNPMQKVRLPKVPYKVVSTFSEKQIEKLLSQPYKKSDAG